MMDLLLVRHGEPDYSDIDERGYIGHGRDLAKLTEKGVRQAERAAEDARLQGAELILSSPYTRAIQTASIISRITQIPLTVETDLHEWMPDLSFMYEGPEEIPAVLREMEMYRGEWCRECRYRWESLSKVGERAFFAVKKYLHCKKIILVAHETVIQRFVKMESVPCGSVTEMDFSQESRWFGYYQDIRGMGTAK